MADRTGCVNMDQINYSTYGVQLSHFIVSWSEGLKLVLALILSCPVWVLALNWSQPSSLGLDTLWSRS